MALSTSERSRPMTSRTEDSAIRLLIRRTSVSVTQRARIAGNSSALSLNIRQTAGEIDRNLATPGVATPYVDGEPGSGRKPIGPSAMMNRAFPSLRKIHQSIESIASMIGPALANIRRMRLLRFGRTVNWPEATKSARDSAENDTAQPDA